MAAWPRFAQLRIFFSDQTGQSREVRQPLAWLAMLQDRRETENAAAKARGRDRRIPTSLDRTRGRAARRRCSRKAGCELVCSTVAFNLTPAANPSQDRFFAPIGAGRFRSFAREKPPHYRADSNTGASIR